MQLFKHDLSIINPVEWFTCASIAYCFDSNEERIAIGSSKGNVYMINVKDDKFEWLSDQCYLN